MFNYYSIRLNIPRCVVSKQTAIIASTLSMKDSFILREVEHRALQDSLIQQGMPLPGVYVTLS
jgi:hypothetical protein